MVSANSIIGMHHEFDTLLRAPTPVARPFPPLHHHNRLVAAGPKVRNLADVISRQRRAAAEHAHARLQRHAHSQLQSGAEADPQRLGEAPAAVALNGRGGVAGRGGQPPIRQLGIDKPEGPKAIAAVEERCGKNAKPKLT